MGLQLQCWPLHCWNIQVPSEIEFQSPAMITALVLDAAEINILV
jgi:hypothetical protein